MSPDSWSNAVGHALYGDAWHDGDLSDGIDDLVPLIDRLGRSGWSPCPGGNGEGHRLPHANLCRACGATFAAIEDGYVPRHDAPTLDALLASAKDFAR